MDLSWVFTIFESLCWIQGHAKTVGIYFYIQGAGSLIQNVKHVYSTMHMCMLSCFSHVQLFVTPWTEPARLLCPWDYPGKIMGVGCCFLLQKIFPTQGSNSCLLKFLH